MKKKEYMPPKMKIVKLERNKKLLGSSLPETIDVIIVN